MSSTTITKTVSATHDTLLKYDQERQKRLRSDGLGQYVDIEKSETLQHYAEDPWITDGHVPNSLPAEDGTTAKAVLIGAGYGALLFAVRLIEIAGFKPEEIIFVDNAGGFGGTWYWNQYPGLMCDVESACYMPLLEETGYVPKHRYSYGTELRQYAELVASKWKLDKRAIFAARVTDASWNAETSQWTSTVTQRAINGQAQRTFKIHSDFFVLTAGLFTRPKMPKVPGLSDFQGESFHTSRWNYDVTGGSPTDLALSKLKDKRVAVLGTGATAVQVVPEVAKWARKLYVIQRTPASVDFRGQRPVNEEEFRSNISHEPGWQKRRRENMTAHVSNIPMERDMVQDGWTTFPSFSALVGGPNASGLSEQTLPSYIASLHTLDLPRSNRVRERVSQVVKDQATAESLKAWYAGWCKRPGFHDDYLAAFNNPNVELIDTAGAGIQRMTKAGFVANGAEYPVDIFIFSTGYQPFRDGTAASRAEMSITGCNGLTFDQKWGRAVGTLHGILTRDFPNLILPGSGGQGGVTINVVHTLDTIATHVASVISAASSKGDGKKVILQPTQQGEEEWSMRIARDARYITLMADCTPGINNKEGAVRVFEGTEEQKLHMARGANMVGGLLSYAKAIEEWREKGDMVGLEITYK